MRAFEAGETEVSSLERTDGGEYVRFMRPFATERACLPGLTRAKPDPWDCIFQPFAQADPSMARRFGGTGLGLPICKSLVELMGGRIWVDSEVGKGTTFCLSVNLPLARELPSDAEAPTAVPAIASSPLRVLLVEDNPANQKLADWDTG